VGEERLACEKALPNDIEVFDWILPKSANFSMMQKIAKALTYDRGDF
jgi:hypothetical protein